MAYLLLSGLYRRPRSFTGSCAFCARGLYRRSGIRSQDLHPAPKAVLFSCPHYTVFCVFVHMTIHTSWLNIIHEYNENNTREQKEWVYAGRWWIPTLPSKMRSRFTHGIDPHPHRASRTCGKSKKLETPARWRSLALYAFGPFDLLRAL
jgi:hypothetical protein